MDRCSRRLLVWLGLVVIGLGSAQADQNVAASVLQGESVKAGSKGLVATLLELRGEAHYSLPPLTERQISKLQRGKVVRIREVPDEDDAPQRVVGLIATAHSKEALWLSLRDRHWTAAAELTEVLLEGESSWPRIWYQHLDAPRPFADRHYVLRIEDNPGLAQATGGACWEHWWTLKEDGPEVARVALASGRIPDLDLAKTEGAVYVPVNDGAWLVCDLEGDQTLLGYHVRFVAGGRIPDRLIADYGMATLGTVLRKVVERASDVREHYSGDHYAIPGGDGPDIPRFGSVGEER